MLLPIPGIEQVELGKREKGMALAREKDQTDYYKLSYTGKEGHYGCKMHK